MNRKFLFEILAIFTLDIYIFGQYSGLVALGIVIAWFAWETVNPYEEDGE